MKKSPHLDTGLAMLLKEAPSTELTYGFVMACLQMYKNPRVKLNHLLRTKALIRIKKGIYIFGSAFAKQPYAVEALANMIYGPSYVSLEWACQYYRLIPEKVTAVTSVTTQRSRQYQTPVGLFTYTHLPVTAFSFGIDLVHFSATQPALIAIKEKALVDTLVIRRGAFTSKKQLKQTLFEDLRCEEEEVASLQLDVLQMLYQIWPHSAIHYLLQYREQL